MLPGIASAGVQSAVSFPLYVGAATGTDNGSGNGTLSLTSLTGGIASAAQAGDLVVAIYAVNCGGAYALDIEGAGAADYSIIGSQISAVFDGVSGNGSQIRVASRIMPSTPDTSITFKYTGFSNDNKAFGALVFRGASSTPDVTPTTFSSTSTLIPNPASITRATPSALIVCIGASGGTATGRSFTAPAGLTDFRTAQFTFGREIRLGFGYTDEGTFDCPAFGLSGGDTTGGSVAMSIAIRPA